MITRRFYSGCALALAAFARANAAGNTPRNFLRGPSQKRVDLSLAKKFKLGQSSRVELRLTF